jgi:hypothetical protein
MKTYDTRLTVTAFGAGLMRLWYQDNVSRCAIIAFQITAQRITDDGVEVDPLAPGIKRIAAMQITPGTHIEASLQQGLRPSASQT